MECRCPICARNCTPTVLLDLDSKIPCLKIIDIDPTVENTCITSAVPKTLHLQVL